MRPLYDRSFIIAVVNQICFTAANCLMAHYARWIEFLGGNVRQVGWIMGAGSVAALVLRPWMAEWIARIGARNAWLAGYAVFIVGALMNFGIDDLGVAIGVSRTLLVFGAAIVITSGITYVSQTAPSERQAEAIGVLGAGGFTGMLFGPYVGDLILAADERTRGSFYLLFAVSIALLVAPAGLLVFLKPGVERQRAAPIRLRTFLRAARDYWPGTILFVHAVFGLCMAVPFGFLASYVDQERIAFESWSAVGLFFLCYAGWGVVLRMGSRRLPDRIGRGRVLIVGAVFMALGMFSFLLVSAERPLLLIVPGLICGSGHALMFHTMVSLAVTRFPLEKRGAASALSMMTVDMGMIGGAPLLGEIAASFGFNALFATIGTASVISAAAYAYSRLPGARGGKQPIKSPIESIEPIAEPREAGNCP